MCVTSAKGYLAKTIVGGWDIQHPTYGYRHVLAYQNSPQNLASIPNCMLLPIPTIDDLVPNDVIDTSACPRLLNDLWLKVKRGSALTLSVSSERPQNHVVEMGVYHLALLNNLEQTALTATLNQIPKEKSPYISPELLSFYADMFPDYRLVLACFNNKNIAEASAIMIHYAPLIPDEIFFPLLEGHEGKVPLIGEGVRRHQEIIYGSYKDISIYQKYNDYIGKMVFASRDGIHTLSDLFKQAYPKTVQPFLPNYIGGQNFRGQQSINDDYWFKLN